MSEQVDLNKLRDIMRRNQRNGCTAPVSPQDKIWVDKEGNIKLGDSVTSREGQQLSEVHPGVFAQSDRHMREAKIVREKMPAQTEYVEGDGFSGWLYSFKCQMDNAYTFFAYYEDNAYQVKVVFPEIEKKFCSPHVAHLFSDGRICFGDDYSNGMPTLEQAYAKSVVWATGFSILLANDEGITDKKICFPFSINNDNDSEDELR